VESFGAGHQQLLALGDRAGDVIRQAAVGKADIGTALDEDNLRSFAIATQTRGSSRAAGYAADDDGFHGMDSVRESGERRAPGAAN
jgi:hypothetical protein